MIKPLHDMVVVKPIQKERVGSIVIVGNPDGDIPVKGKVLAIGPGLVDEKGVLDPLQVAIGDVVMYAANTGIDVSKTEGKGVIMIHEAEVIAVID